MSGTVSAVVITYPERLLSLAQDLAAHEEHPGIAVVVGAMACELAAERRLGKLMRERGVDGDLAIAIDAFLNGHNLGNDRVRSLYAALSNEDITKQPFWSDFKNASSLRNRLVHGAAQPTPDEIETAIKAQAALVEYLKSAGF